MAVANHRGGDADHRLEFGGGVVRLRFLNEPQRDAQHDHCHHQHTGGNVRTAAGGGKRDDRQNGQQNYQRIAHGKVKALQPAVMFFFRDLVGAEYFQPRRRFRFGQAIGRSVMLFEHVGNVLDRGLVDEIDEIGSA